MLMVLYKCPECECRFAVELHLTLNRRIDRCPVCGEELVVAIDAVRVESEPVEHLSDRSGR